MKFRRILIIAIFPVVIMFSCNNDDNDVTVTPVAKDEPKTEPVNQAPGSFELLAVKNDEIAIEFSPTFSWNDAVDPDGDLITYDFYLAKKEEILDPVAIDLSATSIDQELGFSDEYHWKVVAKDSLGASSESETFSFTTRNLYPVKRLTDQTNFSERRGHGLVSFQNRLWLFGGVSEGVHATLGKIEKDLWQSNDGVEWTKVADPAPFGHRNFSTPIVYKEKLYIIGGLSSKPGSGSLESSDYKNDVWASNNGIDWSQIQFDASFSKRAGHSSVVFKDKIWIYGGVNKDGMYYNDLYTSEDGAHWNLVSGNLFNISARASAKFVVFKNKLYIIGGINKTGDFKEIWESENGTDWSLVAQGNEVPVRRLFDAFVYRDKLILVDQFIENKIWYSDDAITWKSIEENTQFMKRQASSSALHNDKIHIIGGWEITNNGGFGDLLNDVWVVE